MSIVFITSIPLDIGGIVVIVLFIHPFSSDCFCSALLSSEEHCSQRLEGDVVFKTSIEKKRLGITPVLMPIISIQFWCSLSYIFYVCV